MARNKKRLCAKNDTETLVLDAVPLCLTGKIKSTCSLKLHNGEIPPKPTMLSARDSEGHFSKHFHEPLSAGDGSLYYEKALAYFPHLRFTFKYKFLLLYYNLRKMCTFITY
jgi:hypothetical protein